LPGVDVPGFEKFEIKKFGRISVGPTDSSFRDAFGYRGCPICRKLDQEEIDFMCRFQSQTLKEEAVRSDLISSQGYCNFHFHEMARLTSPRVNSVVSRDLIDREIEGIEKGSFPSGQVRRCPVCRYVREREESFLREFADLLGEDRVKAEYERSDGLCLVHLKKVLSFPRGRDLRPLLLLTQVNHLKSLKAELEASLEPDGSKGKIRGREKNSWAIAIQKLVGKRGLG
jgi:hypothetical protein